MNVAMAAAKLAPVTTSVIRRTASLPRRGPKTPLTNAPRSGSAMTTAMREKSPAGKRERKSFIGLVLQEVGIVRTDGATDTEEREDDREAHGDLGRLGGDQEEAEHLAGVRVAPAAVERDERDVHRVQHDLDAHQRDDHVAAHQEPDAPDGEERRAERDVIFDGNHERTSDSISVVCARAGAPVASA